MEGGIPHSESGHRIAAAVERAQWRFWEQTAAGHPPTWTPVCREGCGAVLLAPGSSARILDLVDGLPPIGGSDLTVVAAFGGKLIQHLPDHGYENHMPTPGDLSQPGHCITLAPDSLVAQTVGETEHAVHTRHHQGVEDSPDSLLVTERALHDGLVEAVEIRGATFGVGV